ncbi:MAG: hypothetical protein QOC86_2457 [Gaiellales bacterium]|nr:hypothetical protein [Gaiellales bacterium]
MPVDATPPSGHPLLRFVLVLALAGMGLFAVPASQADDLIQLNGDLPVTLQGNFSFGLLYLDGTVRLAADTSISATDVFIGPDAQLQTCYDLVSQNANGCGNGRSLSINASGGVAISPAIDLRGAVGVNRAGGSLSIHAARVSLGGGVETAGTAAVSGSISLDSPGLVVTQSLHAPGAAIVVHGAGGVSIGGDVSSASGDPGVVNGGPVDLASTGGDVGVLGSISSAGRDVAGAGAIPGGSGGPITIGGGDVRISGGLDSSAGRGVDLSAGQPGGISIGARASIVVSGAVTASGDASVGGNGSDGGAVNMSAAGALAAGSISSTGGGSNTLYAGAGGPIALTAGGALSTGALSTTGGASPQAGRHGGAVSVTGASVSLGSITADAGDASSDPANGSGEAGGAVAVKATGTAAVGAISTRGGSGRALGAGGAGGPVSVTGDRVTTGSIASSGENLGGPGGRVTVSSLSTLIVGGAVDTSGAASSSGNAGGGGGPVLLITHGPLTLGGRLRSEGGIGGSGGPFGAAGGNGGSIEIVAQSIASSAGVLSGGGNGGNAAGNGPQGRGGDGGRVRVWAQAPSLILLQLVDSTGGQGNPNGSDGAQLDESAPSDLSITKTFTLAFTPHAPDAEGYRVFASVAGAPAKLLLTTKTPGVALPKVAPCVSVAYTLSGFQSGVGWQSDPIGPIGFMAPPSATQACTDAPQVTLGVQKLKKKLRPLIKKKWRVPIHFLADGMGTVHVVLSRGKKQYAVIDKPLGPVRRTVTVILTIPKKPKNLRKAGKFTVTVTGSAPLGKARSKSTLTLEVTT